MKTGESIRESFSLYGKNPAIILPYLLFGFFNTAVAAKQTVSGAKGSNAALGSLLTALATYGLVTDSTTA